MANPNPIKLKCYSTKLIHRNPRNPMMYDSLLYIVICIVFELSACEYSAVFPAESGSKANDLTQYKVDTACRLLLYI